MEIFKVLGTPTVKEWPEMTKLQYYNFLMPQIKGTGLEQKEKKWFCKDGLDLLGKMLELNPLKRISAK